MKKSVKLGLVLFTTISLSACSESSKKQDSSSDIFESSVISSSEEIKLDVSDHFQADQNGEVKITGTTIPDAKVKIGKRNNGDSTTSDKDGKFELSKKKVDEEKELKINVSKDGKKISKTIIVTPSTEESSKNNQQSSKPSSSNDPELAEINKEIDDHLKLNQGWALGTIDENGNSIENGTPNDDYQNWLIVNSIKWTGTDIEVQVTEDFKDLTTDEKDTLASSIQGAVMSYSLQDERAHIYFYNGENALGRSTVLSATKYKWN